ncbi:MAG: ATP-dependent Clp protease proteolytic subunit [Chlamydiia bacterium]|nr:ATP-dependent Clp protease proteolytic subunit [Chlamydiia bacterium]MCP5492483.1 ATP-dependent Clp protease proteolytic subunit [Chlamydiales bacterium]
MSEEKKPQSSALNDKIDELLLENRRLFFSSAVDENSVTDIIRKLWYLELKDPGKPILFIINSPGGSVDAGFAVWDQIKMISSPVTTLVTGLAASMGSVLSLCGGKGKRFATPNARFMIHQPSIHGVIRGQASDLDIHAKEIIKSRNYLVQLYADATGKDFDTLAKMMDRDTWMSAKEALEFGHIDGIVKSYKDLKIS